MIRHIVMFKLKEFATPADKQAKMQEIKTGLEALIDKIDVLRMIRVDFNVNPAETWDVILTTELDTLEDVSIYANHHPLFVFGNLVLIILFLRLETL